MLGRPLEGRTDPCEPPQEIFHRASHGPNDAAGIRTQIFRNRDLFAIENLNLAR
jgi:hypothetical protein